MSGVIAMEGQLNSVVKEYLDYFGFDSTLAKFNEECISKGKSIANLENRHGSNQKINLLTNEMLHLFNLGQRKDFFRRWVENISVNEINENIAGQKLEFELNIHFAIYYFRKNKDAKAQAQAKDAMNAFKSYIETKGHVLSQIKEFLPYFGLPYSDNPQNNFPEIFSEAWLADLENRLENFLKDSLKMQSQPRLVELLSQQVDNSAELAKQLSESEKKFQVLFKKFNKAQADYHTLIGISAEIVDSLENAISGKPLPPYEYLSNIISRLFNSQIKQSIDLTRPGTAGDYIRRSLAYQKSNIERAENHIYQPLNYDKIKHDLVHSNEKRQLLILQALRWRLTKAESPEIRQKILVSYASGDILNCREKKRSDIIELLLSKNSDIKQYMARFVNALASLNQGRSYLSSNLDVVKTIHTALKSEDEKEDTITKQNLLAALQKLSLRKRLQILMINEDIVEWLINLLEQNEYLSDIILEDASALFMNVSLRTAGKKRLAVDYKRTLKILSELLGNSSDEIRPFINGTLYSVLSVPEVKAHAKAINFQKILEGYLTEGTQEIKHQIKYLIMQINSENPSENPASDSDTEDDDEDEEEDPIVMEANLDRNELTLKQSTDELIGESLLVNEYSTTNEQKSKSKLGLNESFILKRPITPFNLRQSVLLQTKPFSTSDLFADKKADILVIESNDMSVDDNYLKVINNANNKNDNLNKSDVVGFSTRPKIQRTPEPTVSNTVRKVSINTSIQSSSNSITAPKYSITEPRPSSANSIKSKSSSSSGTIVLENSLSSTKSFKK